MYQAVFLPTHACGTGERSGREGKMSAYIPVAFNSVPNNTQRLICVPGSM